MANIDGTEDEVDKMMGQLKVFDNNPLPRYYSEQLQISLFQQNCYISGCQLIPMYLIME